MREGEVQILRTEFQGLEKRLTERFDQTEKHVDFQFTQIIKQLGKMNSRSKDLDDLLRGNREKIGMNGRLYSLETLKPFLCG